MKVIRLAQPSSEPAWPKLLRQEVTPMEKCFFHFMPYQQLPANFEKDYHSVRVDAPDLSATGKFPWPSPTGD